MKKGDQKGGKKKKFYAHGGVAEEGIPRGQGGDDTLGMGLSPKKGCNLSEGKKNFMKKKERMRLWKGVGQGSRHRKKKGMFLYKPQGYGPEPRERKPKGGKIKSAHGGGAGLNNTVDDIKRGPSFKMKGGTLD